MPVRQSAARATGILTAAVDGPAVRQVRWLAISRESPPQGSGSKEPRWVKRHPAVFGALVGAATGASLGYAVFGQDCPPGVTYACFPKGEAVVVHGGIFAGIGALVGFIAGK